MLRKKRGVVEKKKGGRGEMMKSNIDLVRECDRYGEEEESSSFFFFFFFLFTLRGACPGGLSFLSLFSPFFFVFVFDFSFFFPY